MKNLLKRVLPKVAIQRLKHLRNSFMSSEEKRALVIGLNKKKYRQFMSDPDGALKLKELFLFGAQKKTNFLKESKAFIIESIFEDAYQLEKIPITRQSHVKIVDVGANVGTFAIAARNQFPKATIHCYEPQLCLEKYLKLQAYAVGAKYFMEAVNIKDGYFSSDETQNEILQSQSVKIMDFTRKGDVKASSLQTAIERIGGYIDLLKLDCEGSEWVLLKDKNSLKNVKYLTIEFHRLSPDGSFDIYDRSIDIHEKARKAVIDAGFEILFERYHSVDAGIILARRKDLSD